MEEDEESLETMEVAVSDSSKDLACALTDLVAMDEVVIGGCSR